jgi:hypothetical protein
MVVKIINHYEVIVLYLRIFVIPNVHIYRTYISSFELDKQ